MRKGICICAAGALLAGPAPALAQPKDATALSGVDVVVKRTTRLSELEVAVPLCPRAKAPDAAPAPGSVNSIVRSEGRFDEEPPPKVVSSYPAKGDVVRPGLLVLRVTFDRPMTCVGVLQNDYPLRDPCPPPLLAPMISRDKRTFLTVCNIEANHRYGLKLANFASAAGQSLPGYELVFDTAGPDYVTKVEDALAQDKWLRKPKG